MTNHAFLSKVPLHSLLMESPGTTYHRIASPTFRHRAVMGLFEDVDSVKPREKLNVLFRLETPTTEPPYLLIQSAVSPSDEALMNISGLQCKEIELKAPTSGTPVAFRIAVNAIRRTTITIDRHKRRTLVKPVELDGTDSPNPTISEWIAAKLEPALTELSVTNHLREVITDPRTKKKPRTMTVQVDTIDGVARVADPVSLEKILSDGIGREKAYGCGLLTIRPLR